MLQQGILVDDNMSNLTSASNEASISSSNKNEISGSSLYPHQSFPPPNNPAQPPPAKKKRNLPGNPDPDAEVIALSPRSLLATNRFVCEICNKGFQRDQNLQLHRRGHNLPWKLKQRSNKEVVKKKVYVCPEPSCVHHDPSRALGDLTGIKKHFCRKHGEKKWKCEKCSKRYAVQSDWKAHSKICGTREYRCDCGTLFSRRDSFITHRAFCDALAEESSRSISQNPLFSSNPGPSNLHNLQSQLHGLPQFQLKQEHHQIFTTRPEIPPWLAVDHSGAGAGAGAPQSEMYNPEQQHVNPNPNNNNNPTLLSSSQSFQAAASPHMSATALLQKAAQMGVTMSGKATSQSDGVFHPHHHMGAATPPALSASTLASSAGLALPSREEMATGFSQFGNKIANSMMNEMNIMANSLPSTSGFDHHGLASSSSFEDVFNGNNSFQESLQKHAGQFGMNKEGGGGGAAGTGGGNDGMTRDFLGLRPFPHRDFLNMAGLDQIGSSSSSYDHQQSQSQNQAPWQS